MPVIRKQQSPQNQQEVVCTASMNIIPMAMSCENNEFYGSSPSCYLQSQSSFQTSAWRPCSERESGMEAYIQLWGRYATPPYLTVRENITKEIALIVQGRQLLDINQRIAPVSGVLQYDSEKREVQFQAAFAQSGNPIRYAVIDSQKRTLTEQGGSLKAKDVRQGSGDQCEFQITSYKSSVLPPSKPLKGIPVVIQNKNHSYLSCAKSSTPRLELEQVSSKDLKNISGDSERFIFWKEESGSNDSSFRSQTNDNFYIATSKSHENVNMANKKNSNEIIEFQLDGCPTSQSKIIRVLRFSSLPESSIGVAKNKLYAELLKQPITEGHHLLNRDL
ncbi:uncharacterized protein LOC115469705 [Microcaecilia unicolor]|uniref:Interleukin-1 beta n=1 Tax=Microcaecilia unicolor TaxID=1415580 RepID=A0A6P7XZM9_9AMPH|nr:uncharacterized protein LOC115469705 [Microcaecilia unicolor]